MMNNRLFILALSIIMSLPSAAQLQLEEISLYNGVKYFGYISEQNFLNRNVQIKAELRIASIKSSAIKSKKENERLVSTLAQPLQDWLGDHPELLIGSGDESKVLVTRISRQRGEDIEQAIVLEDGDRVKFIEATIGNIPDISDSIKSIKRSARPQKQITGLIDVVELQTGEIYDGQIVSKDLGKNIRLLKDNGRVQVISMKSISAISKRPLNDKLSLYAQSPYVETIEKKNGTTYTGVISKETYGKRTTLYITSAENTTEPVESSEIRSISRKQNSAYEPQFSRTIDNDEFIVCNNVAPKSETEIVDDIVFVFDGEEEGAEHLVIGHDTIDTFVLETMANSTNKTIYLVPLKMRKYTKKDDNFSFSFGDILVLGIDPVEEEMDMNGITKRTYDMLKPGHYALYRKADKRVHWIEIK